MLYRITQSHFFYLVEVTALNASPKRRLKQGAILQEHSTSTLDYRYFPIPHRSASCHSQNLILDCLQEHVDLANNYNVRETALLDLMH